MPYLRVAKRQTQKGLKWTALQVSSVVKGKKSEKKLTPIVFRDLGFSENMTLTQARDHAKKLNALNQVKRSQQAKKIRASENLHELGVIENSLVDKNMSDQFVDYLEENWFGGQYNLRKQIQQWSLVQKIITKLKLQPSEYFKKKKTLYKYFLSKQWSPSYIEKILKVMNLWGEFYAEQTHTFFKRVPNPKDTVLESIREAAKATGEGATPLTPKMLAQIKDKMPGGQWEYLHATLWLGLRPSELDSIIKDKDECLKFKTQSGTKVVGVYQAKLSGVAKSMRWKWIPIIFNDQKLAIKNINTGTLLKKPLVKTIRNYSSVEGLGLYSGRKGFTDLMLDHNQSLENISQWLGHASIERTWKHYKNKQKVSWTEVG